MPRPTPKPVDPAAICDTDSHRPPTSAKSASPKFPATRSRASTLSRVMILPPMGLPSSSFGPSALYP